jgi:hypothetical protein
MRFCFLSDPAFVASLSLYLLNRLVLKRLWPCAGFTQDYVNDLICLPFWVPVMLWLMRCCRLRDDAPPQWYEILLPLIIWSVLFEIYFPRLNSDLPRPFIGDPADIAAYATGGLIAALFWRWWYNAPNKTGSRTPRR